MKEKRFAVAGRMRPLGLGLVVCAALWFGAQWAIHGSPGGKVTWESVFSWIKRDWPQVPQMTTEQLAAQMKAEPPVLIDTRARQEYEVSHLPGALWAESPRQIRQVLQTVPATRAVVFYCSVGVRSSRAAAEQIQAGRKHVFNLRGSIFQWANEGRSLESKGGPATTVHPYNRQWGALLDPKLHAQP